ncbi:MULTISPECIES: hypothetical protein [Sinorhizobium]|uniref:hypothetical protein n=1 Tax=Sinorhizobium TaxID=28105 RepID=UPI000C7B97CB|nr:MULTISPECIES: hypothetical protein [Sinorhizobium]MDX1017153.1 hypothetical protein [Sinorhizobium medicae]PLU46995.1 hypothetical protein BMJ25_17410 [Sinorhizobium medicae]RVI88616.1 hypothetical protein CN190_10875 [Sinorhizobium meliloti]
MAVEDLISDLEKAEAGNRLWDGPIGLVVGWKRKVEYIKADGNESARKVIWFLPDGSEGRVPNFTSSLDAALLLARTVAPNDVWGVSYAAGRGTAMIGNMRYSEAATPALALCIAALRLKIGRADLDE